jgi:hypothetical protein
MVSAYTMPSDFLLPLIDPTVRRPGPAPALTPALAAVNTDEYLRASGTGEWSDDRVTAPAAQEGRPQAPFTLAQPKSDIQL